jgi:RNA polymerase sigma-70 factor (ECF subfamily)
MSGELNRTTELLAGWRAGREVAREELLKHSGERLLRLTRKMLREQFAHVKRWEETDDVLQQAMLRLHTAMSAVKPESTRHFYNLATMQIRRELIDLARSYYGPQGQGANHETDVIATDDNRSRSPKHEASDSSGEPTNLAEWTEFHERVVALPTEEREVVDLLWYQDLSQVAAAELLGVSERTVRRRWVAAQAALAAAAPGRLAED